MKTTARRVVGCPLCERDLGSRIALRKHLQMIHGWTLAPQLSTERFVPDPRDQALSVIKGLLWQMLIFRCGHPKIRCVNGHPRLPNTLGHHNQCDVCYKVTRDKHSARTTECPTCGLRLRKKNLGRHKRLKHP